jgi:hypothetical protein
MSYEFTSGQNNKPPRVVGTDPEEAVQSAATAVAATSSALWTAYPADPSGLTTPSGKQWTEFEATGFDVYFRCSRTASTGTTVANGSVLKVGEPRIFYLDPTKDVFLDHISPGGVGLIKWRKVAPIGERARA